MWRRGPTLLLSYNSSDLHTALNTFAQGKSCPSSRRFRARVKLEKAKKKHIPTSGTPKKKYRNSFYAIKISWIIQQWRDIYFSLLWKREKASHSYISRGERTLSLWKSSSEDEWSQSEEFSSFSSMMMAMWFRRTSVHRDIERVRYIYPFSSLGDDDDDVIMLCWYSPGFT